MKLVPILFVSLLGWCVLLTGCGGVPKLGGITVSVTGFRPAEASQPPTHAIITLRFTSENLNAIAFSGSSHKLYLNGSYIGTVTDDTPLGLPPQGTVIHEVTFNLENPGVVRQALSVSDQASYRLESALYFSDIEEKRRIKTVYEGSVTLHGLEAAAAP
jgi:hypothetical protein